MLQQFDVFMQLLFSFVPIILSIIVSALINRDKNPEKDNYLQCAAICSGFNFISLVVEYICISAVAGANDIYEVTVILSSRISSIQVPPSLSIPKAYSGLFFFLFICHSSHALLLSHQGFACPLPISH